MPPFEVLKSEKNRDVLLVEGFLFWFDRATPRGRKYWKCIYCYRGHDGIAENKCLSRVITSPNEPEAIMCKAHNHEMDKVLVEHMKAFGSIRRLASTFRSTRSRTVVSKFPLSSTPSTSAINGPLDLSQKRFHQKQSLSRDNSKTEQSSILNTFYTQMPTITSAQKSTVSSTGILPSDLINLTAKLNQQFLPPIPIFSDSHFQSTIFSTMGPMLMPNMFTLSNPLLAAIPSSSNPLQALTDPSHPLGFNFNTFASVMSTAMSMASQIGHP